MQENKKQIWEFTDNQTGNFKVKNSYGLSSLYFPLCNYAGMVNHITPELKGDIALDFHKYLSIPSVTEDFTKINWGRNYWIKQDKKVWSIPGNSTLDKQKIIDSETGPEIDAGIGWLKLSSVNKSIGIDASVTCFVPANDDTVEISIVTLKNITKKDISVQFAYSVPLFGRSADRLRDHRQVASMLNRFYNRKYGIILKPSMVFDEEGHKRNNWCYYTMGFKSGSDIVPDKWCLMTDFVGNGTYDYPEAIIKNLNPQKFSSSDTAGQEGIGALRFNNVKINAGKVITFYIINGINSNLNNINNILRKYKEKGRIDNLLKETKEFWQKKTDYVDVDTSDKNFDQWIKWVNFQPILRKIYGNSYLPDFGYGRGGRGWRDIWQDLLTLIISEPDTIRDNLIQNFKGVRIDGTNATIIGRKKGEFKADRNDIARTWMDHGVWPFLTLLFYIHQTGDVNILFEKVEFFKDKQIFRARDIDKEWSEKKYGKYQRDKNNRIVKRTILEHILVQLYSVFYNVGKHNIMLLEAADWNDGLDMAWENGESVPFTAMYGNMMNLLADALEYLSEKFGKRIIEIYKELDLFIEKKSGITDYKNIKNKRDILDKYCNAVSHKISGNTKKLDIKHLIKDLRNKKTFIFDWINKKEWISINKKYQFYNSYYNEDGKRVDGNHKMGPRINLTGQVFTLLSQMVSPRRIKEIVRTVNKYLKDNITSGIKLLTDYKEQDMKLGRSFGFAYGWKENGAVFNHMDTMYINGLFKNNAVHEAHKILYNIYRSCIESNQSMIFPGMPEYFNKFGKGEYHYLTGSATWMLLTILTEMFGIKGYYGDLQINPKLMADQFDNSKISVSTNFRNYPVKFIFINPNKKSFGSYRIKKLELNGNIIEDNINHPDVIVPFKILEKSIKKDGNECRIYLI